jgi:Predicted hydrolases or acyltransferases (alpha/beta hydrolase superfamily)
MPKTISNEIELNYEIQGEGKPLVLISGLGYPLWQWHKMVPFLAKQFQVITFDNRGVGQSDKPAGPYTAQMLAADTIGLLDALGIVKAIVMGHSMGGSSVKPKLLIFPRVCTNSFCVRPILGTASYSSYG